MNATELGRPVTLARREALALHSSYPGAFKRVPVRSEELADLLGFRVEWRSDLQPRAQLEILQDEGQATATIIVQSNLRPGVERFAIAHEIGHAMLLRTYPSVARAWTLQERETFANCFARELLMPSALREDTARAFREIQDPALLLSLASRLGLSSQTLLAFASSEPGWISGLDKLWLRAEHRANVYSGLDPKLRIVRAHYDRSRYYVPTNQSVSSFAGGDEWLACRLNGVVTECDRPVRLNSVTRDTNGRRRFSEVEREARLSAIRLRSRTPEDAGFFIILVMLLPR